MTHQEQSNALDSIVEILAEHGFEGMACQSALKPSHLSAH
jgi:hypothetical protein